jgi:hypothetical protein
MNEGGSVFFCLMTYYPNVFVEELRKLKKILARIVRVSAEIRTRKSLNTKQDLASTFCMMLYGNSINTRVKLTRVYYCYYIATPSE